MFIINKLIIKFQLLIVYKSINKAFSNNNKEIITYLLKMLINSKIMSKWVKIGILVIKRFNINYLLNINRTLIKTINNNNSKTKDLTNKALISTNRINSKTEVQFSPFMSKPRP
jgi:hypothetical protein